MTDYYESRHPSRDLSYGGDPAADENAMRRSITRGSHQSHASVSASTRSWVYSNQIHPPPPPDDSTPSPSPALTPLRRQRPLPDPHLHQSRLAFQYGQQDADEVEYMNVNPNGAPLQFGYQEGLVEERPIIPVPSSPVNDYLSPPTRGGRSFVGGFFSGLKRLPKLVLRSGGGEKRRLKRKGTFGTDTHTEGTSTTATAITRGNTLPRYLSNPSIGPSNPQFAHRLSMAVANGSLPPDSTPAVFHVRNNPAGPQFPIVTVTPASDGIVEEEQADFYDGPTGDDPQFSEDSEPDRPPNERATVMVYSSDSQAPTVTQAPTGPPPARQPTPGPRVSYQAQLPTRATAQAQAQTEPLPAPTPTPLHAPIPRRPSPPIQSPRPIHSPREVLSSTQPTSNYTISAVPSVYDPSFASDLTPIEKFFKGLYNLPWVGQERVTVDYRPADSKRAQSKVRGLKKPMASWYRSVMSRSRRGSRNLDLLSSGTVTPSAGPSLGNTPSPLGSPISRRSGRSSNNNRHHSPKPKRHQRNRHRATSTSTSGVQRPQRTSSPIIPTTYPYTYPGYPYAYPYGAYPAMPVPHTSPRGPRSHRRTKAPKYPHGYTPYQPMAMPPQMTAPPPPIYFISPSPPQSQSGEFNPITYSAPPPGPMQVSPVIMQFVPGAFNQNPAMISPPLTPQRPAAFG